MELGTRIKNLREEAGLTQLAFAKILNINNSTLSQYESGDRIPSDATKVKIADFFRVSLDYLLGRTDTKNTHDTRASGEPVTKFLEQRKLHKYSQQQLANMLFVNQTAVSQWDRGVTIPSPPTLLKLSEIYGVSTDYLLGKEGKKEPVPIVEDGMDDQEKELLRLIKDLTPDQKNFLLVQLRTLIEQG